MAQWRALDADEQMAWRVFAARQAEKMRMARDKRTTPSEPSAGGTSRAPAPSGRGRRG